MKYLVALILGWALYATNPTQEDFNSHIKQHVTAQMPADSPLVRLLVGGVVGEWVKHGVQRRDYLLFSKYTIDTAMISSFNPDVPPRVEFIGVFGSFIPLSGIGQAAN